MTRTGEARDELREMVWPEDDPDNRVAHDVRYLRMFGTDAGILLSQLVFWTGKGWDPDGWVYKTKDEIRDEFGLDSRHAVDKARHRLQKAGVLEMEKWARKGWRDGVYRITSPSPVLHYRVELSELASLLERFGYDPEGTIAMLKRGFEQPKAGGPHSQNGSLNHGFKQSRADGLNCRGSAIQTVEGRPFESVKVDRSIYREYVRGNVRESPERTFRGSALQAGKETISKDMSKKDALSLSLPHHQKQQERRLHNTSTPARCTRGERGPSHRENATGDGGQRETGEGRDIEPTLRDGFVLSLRAHEDNKDTEDMG